MNYFYAYKTDTGIYRNINQDAFLVKSANIIGENTLLLAVCDGLGGKSPGRKMSIWTASMLSEWFDEEFLWLISESSIPFSELIALQIISSLKRLIRRINNALYNENLRLGAFGGTTLSLILFWNGRRYIMHIGDSRIYEIVEHEARQLTNDDSLVAREVRMGRMSPEDARNSPKQNVLLKCLGSSFVLKEPEIYFEPFYGKAVYLLCTDGFWRSIEQNELINNFSPKKKSIKETSDDKAHDKGLGLDKGIHLDKEIGLDRGIELNKEFDFKQDENNEQDIYLGKCLDKLIAQAKSRGEKDNLTAVAAFVY